MLTRMHFKNWRSLKDVEINDLTSPADQVSPC